MTSESSPLFSSKEFELKKSSWTEADQWKKSMHLIISGFALGIVVTLMAVAALTRSSSFSASGETAISMLNTKEHNPALHYFAKASTDFTATLPLMVDRDNSFLADLVKSTDAEKPITSGFYRQEKGDPLVYTYTYHEMKIIVAGEFYISDDAGNSVHATPGDVFYFPKGSKITFDSPSFGLGFFCGQRDTGEA